MRVAIGWRWLTVSSPACMCDTRMRVEDLGKVWILLLDKLLELCNLAYFLEGEHFIFLVAIDRQTSRIVASVFQARESWASQMITLKIKAKSLPFTRMSRMYLRSLSTR